MDARVAAPRGRVAMFVLVTGLVAVAYYLAGRFGLELAYLNGAVAALWPPAGLGLAVLFLWGPRVVPGIIIGDLWLGDYSTPLGTVVAQTVGNTVAVVVAAMLLRRLTQGRAGLERVYDVLALIAAALVAALISAAFGPLALRLGGVIPTDELGSVFRTWTLGDAAGVLVVAPVILTWAARGRERHPPAQCRRGRDRPRRTAGARRDPGAARRPVRRVPGAVVGGAALRTARCGHGGADRVLDRRLEDRAQQRAVRPRLAHRQPARDAAVHRHHGRHFTAAGRRHRGAHEDGARPGGDRGGAARARRRAGGAAPGRHAGRPATPGRAACSSW